MPRSRVLILWNQIDEDVVELWRRDGRRSPDWDPTKIVEPWDTVAEEVELLVKAIKGAGHDVVAANISDNFQTLIETIDREKPDVIMNLVEFFHDDAEQEHHVPALFELMNVSYTGNRPLALSICQKKPHAKAMLAANGLPVPRGIVIEQGKVPEDLQLKFPMIVKPAYDDASGGIDSGSVVHDRAALEARVHTVLTENKMAALVEEYIEGREIHCAIIGNDPPEAMPLYEMKFKDGVDNEGRKLPHIITYRAKWDPYSRDYYAMESKCPPDDLEPALAAKIQDIAIRAYKVMGCRDYARVDMRVDPSTGSVYILEVNPNPDLADGCAFAQCVRASGRTYDQAVQEIIAFALERARKRPKRDTGTTDMLLREYLVQRGRLAR
ncbi:MAG: D-alanine-D-alanine ligase [Myxococcales bacterium]|nr:D-alanine-D-alanine ligase [Myxococcales bacterium]